MKFFIAVFVLNIVLAINAKEIDSNLEEKCLKEIGIDQEAYTAALDSKADDVDMAVKCMSRCMLKEKKMINEDGAFDVQQIAASLFTEPENVEVAKPFIESCLKEVKKEADEKKEREEETTKEEEEEETTKEGEEETTKEGEEETTKEGEEETKTEPTCEEAFDMIVCVTLKIEEALKDN